MCKSGIVVGILNGLGRRMGRMGSPIEIIVKSKNIVPAR